MHVHIAFHTSAGRIVAVHIPAGRISAGHTIVGHTSAAAQGGVRRILWCDLDAGTGKTRTRAKRWRKFRRSSEQKSDFLGDLDAMASAPPPRASVLPGIDSDGRSYGSATEMWKERVGEVGVDGAEIDVREIQGSAGTVGNQSLRDGQEGLEEANAMDVSEEDCGRRRRGDKREEWYHKGVSYWENVEASVDGVLGGYGKVSKADVTDSREFIAEVFGHNLSAARTLGRPTVALDCGAGIGRVTKEFLSTVFDEVDLVEPVAHFLEAARSNLAKTGGCGPGRPAGKAVNFYCCPLQDFTPSAGRYDVIWVQWCIGHLTDSDFMDFFRRCAVGLVPGGIFVVKENTCQQGFVLDTSDSSVTRSDAYFRRLFKQAGLKLIKSKVQRGFPKELFSVKMYALRPPQGDDGTSPPSPPITRRQAQQKKQPNLPAVIY